jgi:ribosome biogenesis GTPase A
MQWYPGHIAKWDKQLLATLKKVDAVIEVLDSRLPSSTQHPELQLHIGKKPCVRLLNKSGLSDANWSSHWRRVLQTSPATVDTDENAEKPSQEPQHVLLFDAHDSSKAGCQQLTDILVDLGQAVFLKQQRKGLKALPLKVLIVGMPNVGKSSVINKLIGRKKAVTGHKAGITREPRWLRIHPQLDLLDSPGIIPPRLESWELGARLAWVSSISEAVFDDIAIAGYLAEVLQAMYPTCLAKHYGINAETLQTLPHVPVGEADRLAWLQAIAQARNLIQAGSTPDLLRAAYLLLTDFRHGRLGRLTLERPVYGEVSF